MGVRGKETEREEHKQMCVQYMLKLWSHNAECKKSFEVRSLNLEFIAVALKTAGCLALDR